MKSILLFVALVCVGGALCSPAVRTFISTDFEKNTVGLTVEKEDVAEMVANNNNNIPSENEAVVFSVHEDVAIYEWVSMSNEGQDIAAATQLNPVYSENLLATKAQTTWKIASSAAGAIAEVASSRDGQITVAAEWVALGYNLSGVIRVFEDGSSSPLWEKKIDGVGAGYGSMSVSADGKYFALVASVNNSYVIPGHARAYCFSTASPEPLHEFDVPMAEYASQISSLSEDLRFVFSDSNVLHAVDCAEGRVVWSYDRQFTTSSLSMSADGEYIGTSFTSLEVFKRTADGSYEPHMNVPLSSSAGGSILWAGIHTTFSSKNQIAVSAYNGNTVKQNIIEVFNLETKNLTWRYEYKPCDNQPLQETPSALVYSNDGSFLVAGSWGDQNHTNPTVHVFCAVCGKVVFTFDTPGSVFSVDTYREGDSLRVAVGGKHVHANVMGAGGDLYSLSFPLPKTEDHCEMHEDEEEVLVSEAIAEDLNSQPGMTWVAGVSDRFKGLTVKEAMKLTGTNINLDSMRMAGVPLESNVEDMGEDDDDVNDIPKEFDAVKTFGECIHPIRDQAQCGSCWAFSASEVLSDRYCIASKQKSSPVLSPQDLVSCDKKDYGCGGGYLYFAWEFMESYGLVTETCMPYTSASGAATACPANKCTDSEAWAPIKVKNGTLQYYGTPEQLQRTLMTEGPVQVAFSVYGDFFNYKSGVYQHSPNAAIVGGHAVKLTGWGVSDDGIDYWVVSNSWGTGWGINGTFWIRRGINECGIEFNSIWGTPQI